MDTKEKQQEQLNVLEINRSFKTILVHAPNWVGDHVMAFPFYLTLKELFPNADSENNKSYKGE